MKSIIAATDFSPVGDNAANYAAGLASAYGMDLQLLHCFLLPVSLNDIPALTFPMEELQKNADNGLDRLKEQLEKTYPTIKITRQSIPAADTASAIIDYCDEKKPFAVCAGTHGNTALENWLGSTSLSMVKHIHQPVFTVPEGYQFRPITKFALASDLKKTGDGAHTVLSDLTKTMQANMEVVHVSEEKAEMQSLKQLPFDHSFKQVDNKDIVDGLQTYIREANPDLLVIITRHHGLFQNLFSKPTTEKLIESVRIPVVSIRDKH